MSQLAPSREGARAPGPGTLFADAPLPAGPQLRARLDAAHARHGAAFESRAAHDRFFGYIVTPASGRWAFVPNGKAATTSALALLFRLEFGHPLTVRLADPSDLNRDPAPHRLTAQGVFRMLHQRRDEVAMADYLDAALRVATVRHPARRAWSAFRYLCRSDALGHMQFAADRTRMCVRVGFDWTRHANGREGFLRFLDYVAQSCDPSDPIGPNNHWAPQWMTLRPAVYRPDLIGRAEDVAGFAHALAARLGVPDRLPEPAGLNADPEGGALPEWLADPAVRRALELCYMRDYEEFGYAH